VAQAVKCPTLGHDLRVVRSRSPSSSVLSAE